MPDRRPFAEDIPELEWTDMRDGGPPALVSGQTLIPTQGERGADALVRAGIRIGEVRAAKRLRERAAFLEANPNAMHDDYVEAAALRNFAAEEEIATILRQRADRLTDHPDEKNDTVNHACARELWKLADAIQGDDTYEAEHIPAMQQELGRLRARVRELEAERPAILRRATALACCAYESGVSAQMLGLRESEVVPRYDQEWLDEYAEEHSTIGEREWGRWMDAATMATGIDPTEGA